MKFEIERSSQGFARNILEDGRVILHLNEGTIRNEENIERLVYLLNLAKGLPFDPDRELGTCACGEPGSRRRAFLADREEAELTSYISCYECFEATWAGEN